MTARAGMIPSPESGSLAALRRAAAEGLDGKMRLHVGESLVGQVLFVRGRVAWATSRGQSETLGTFLWRLGHVTRGQLAVVKKVFEAHQGRKKFGQLLEELGLMPRPVLRHCLLLHTREAFRTLLACPEAVVSTAPGAVEATEELTFALEEVLSSREAPGGADLPVPRSGATPGGAPGAPLAPLLGIHGYLASAVISARGEVLAGHATDERLDLASLGGHACAIADGSARLAASAGLGGTGVVSVDFAGGAATIRWIDEERRNLLVVLMSAPAHQARARLAVEEALPALRRWTAPASVGTFFKALVERAGTPQEQIQALQAAIRVRLHDLRAEEPGDGEVERLEEALDLVNEGKLADAADRFSRARSG